jgi:hypothetical protein
MMGTVSTTTVWATPRQGAQVRDRALDLDLGSQHQSMTKYKVILSTGYEDTPSQHVVRSCLQGNAHRAYKIGQSMAPQGRDRANTR